MTRFKSDNLSSQSSNNLSLDPKKLRNTCDQSYFSILYLRASLLILGTFIIFGCVSKKPSTDSSYDSVLLESTDLTDMQSIGFVDTDLFPPDASGHKSILLKFSKNSLDTDGTIRLPILGKIKNTIQAGQIEIDFSIGRITTVFLTSALGPQQLNAANLESIPLHVTCRYQSFLHSDENIANEIEIFGSLVAGNYGLRNNSMLGFLTEKITVPAQSTADSVLNACEQRFQESYSKKARDGFHSLATNMSYGLSSQRCTIPEPPSSPNGDSECNAWFNARMLGRNSGTLPRCVQKKGLTGRTGFCTIYSRYNQPCPIFVNDRQRYVGSSDEVILEIATNPVKKQYFCDQSVQQECHALKGRGPQHVRGLCKLP